MTEQEGVALMQSSTSSQDWSDNVDKLKDACGGQYPDWWYGAIVLSGVMGRTAAKWGGTDEISISRLLK